MQKKFTPALIALLIIGVFSELIVPMVLSGAASSRFAEITQAKDLKMSLQSRPGLSLLLGKVDKAEITAGEMVIGRDVRVSDFVLIGSRIQIDSKKLISGGGLQIANAGDINFSGYVTEAALKELIEKRVEKIEEVAATIKPDKIVVTGKANLLGHSLNVELDGTLGQNDNILEFHVSRLNIEGTKLGRTFVRSLFGDVELVDFSRFNLPARLRSVEQQNGKVLLTFAN